jgi:transposase-like protein
MAQQEFSLPALMAQVPGEVEAYQLLERLRWNGQPVCAHCGATKVYFLTPKGGHARLTRTGSLSVRRVWKCAACRKQFSVLTGTIFHGTKIPVRTWVFVIFEMAASKNGVAAREIERKYDLTPKTAWFMCHRIREAMKREPLAGLLSGKVASDETWIGGAPGNRHADTRPVRSRWERPHTDKPAVLALIDTASGEVRSQVIPNVKGATLRAAIYEHVEMGATTLITDEAKGYKAFSGEMKGHETVNHARDQYVRGGWTTKRCRGVLLPAQALDRRHAPPRQQEAPGPLPRGARLPLLHLQDGRLRAHAAPAPHHRAPPDLPATDERVVIVRNTHACG